MKYFGLIGTKLFHKKFKTRWGQGGGSSEPPERAPLDPLM